MKILYALVLGSSSVDKALRLLTSLYIVVYTTYKRGRWRNFIYLAAQTVIRKRGLLKHFWKKNISSLNPLSPMITYVRLQIVFQSHVYCSDISARGEYSLVTNELSSLVRISNSNLSTK